MPTPCMYLVKSSQTFLLLLVQNTHTHTHTPHPPVADLKPPARSVCCGWCSWSQVRDGCQVSATLGQTSVSLSEAVHCSWPRDRLWALAVNICSRDCTICPKPWGEPSLLISHQLQSPRRGPEQSFRGGEHGQDTVIGATERWNSCLTHLAMFYL